jgi:rubrerythrin
MYPEFADRAKQDRDLAAEAEFKAQQKESQEHAQIFGKAASNFGFLTSIEHHHADQYSEALRVLQGKTPTEKATQTNPETQKWICRQCSMIYDPVFGDPDDE